MQIWAPEASHLCPEKEVPGVGVVVTKQSLQHQGGRCSMSNKAEKRQKNGRKEAAEVGR